MNILNPENTLYLDNTSLALNYTVLDANGDLDSCWYNLDGGNNISLVGCTNTTFDTSEGSHMINVYANDSENNWNETLTSGYGSWDVVVLSSPPIVNITRPMNDTNYTGITIINYTIIDDTGDSCWYSWDCGTNNESEVQAGDNFTSVVSSE